MAKIILCPGHGGSDPGAVKNIREADFNYSFAKHILSSIQGLSGDGVIIGSEGGVSDAVKKANAYGKDAVLLSIHANCCGGTGYESYYAEGYYSGKTRELVDGVHAAYAAAGLRNRGIKSDKTTRFGRLGILRDTKMPATLIECGFVDNDAALLADQGFQVRMGDAIARALMKIAGQTVHEPVTPQPAPQPAQQPAPAPSNYLTDAEIEKVRKVLGYFA